MTTLIIARHGNTFEDNETPRRVGRRTDLPLTAKGREQAEAIGRYLKANNLLPDAAFCGNLQRTAQTAQLALAAAGVALSPHPQAMLDEIDYGPDENKTEAEVIARVDENAIRDWDEKAVVPPGWDADPQAIIQSWLHFGASLAGKKQTVLAVTSNGIARFAPHLTGDFDSFRKDHKLKISTGALCVLKHGADGWNVSAWNVKP